MKIRKGLASVAIAVLPLTGAGIALTFASGNSGANAQTIAPDVSGSGGPGPTVTDTPTPTPTDTSTPPTTGECANGRVQACINDLDFPSFLVYLFFFQGDIEREFPVPPPCCGGGIRG